MAGLGGSVSDDEFARHLAWAFRGEVSGEVLFSDLAERFTEHRAELELLVELERRMQAVLEPVVQRYRIDPGDLDRTRRTAHDNTAAAAEGGWDAFLGQFDAVTTHAIERYQLLGRAMPTEGPAGLAELLVHHEEALRSFARAQLSSEGPDSTSAVAKALEAISAWETAQP